MCYQGTHSQLSKDTNKYNDFFTDNGRWYDFRGDAIIKWSECRHEFRGNYNYIETV